MAPETRGKKCPRQFGMGQPDCIEDACQIWWKCREPQAAPVQSNVMDALEAEGQTPPQEAMLVCPKCGLGIDGRCYIGEVACPQCMVAMENRHITQASQLANWGAGATRQTIVSDIAQALADAEQKGYNDGLDDASAVLDEVGDPESQRNEGYD